eukprot:1331961-Amorphochlora_amoeboformis.AAC.1
MAYTLRWASSNMVSFSLASLITRLYKSGKRAQSGFASGLCVAYSQDGTCRCLESCSRAGCAVSVLELDPEVFYRPEALSPPKRNVFVRKLVLEVSSKTLDTNLNEEIKFINDASFGVFSLESGMSPKHNV